MLLHIAGGVDERCIRICEQCALVTAFRRQGLLREIAKSTSGRRGFPGVAADLERPKHFPVRAKDEPVHFTDDGVEDLPHGTLGSDSKVAPCQPDKGDVAAGNMAQSHGLHRCAPAQVVVTVEEGQYAGQCGAGFNPPRIKRDHVHLACS